MASSRSVGVLSLFINGDATGLMKEFNTVNRQLARWSKSWTEPGAKLALGFVGVENALKAVSNSVRNVVQNIETIPGVPPTTVASIVTMRDNLASAKTWIDQMTAGIVGFGAQAAQAAGVFAAGLTGANDTSALSKLEAPDEVAAARDQQFGQKIDAARKKLAETRKASELAAMAEVQQIVALRREAERYETYAKSKSINTLQRLDAETEAQERLNQANSKMAALKKELDAAERKSGEAFGAVIGASSAKDPNIRLVDLQRQEEATRRKVYDLMQGDQNDPAVIEQQIRLREQLTKIYERQVPLLEKQKELGRAVSESLSTTFASAIVEGRKFSDVLRGLAADLAELILKKALLGVFSSFTGGLGSIFGGFFADGGRPPLGKVSVVGENGPELFVPDTAGRIIPNDTLRSVGQRSAGSVNPGNTYIIDARGTDESVVLRLQQAMMALAGPGVVERRSIAAVADAKRRRTAAGYAL